jgi:hypothetical protein
MLQPAAWAHSSSPLYHLARVLSASNNTSEVLALSRCINTGPRKSHNSTRCRTLLLRCFTIIYERSLDLTECKSFAKSLERYPLHFLVPLFTNRTLVLIVLLSTKNVAKLACDLGHHWIIQQWHITFQPLWQSEVHVVNVSWSAHKHRPSKHWGIWKTDQNLCPFHLCPATCRSLTSFSKCTVHINFALISSLLNCMDCEHM